MTKHDLYAFVGITSGFGNKSPCFCALLFDP